MLLVESLLLPVFNLLLRPPDLLICEHTLLEHLTPSIKVFWSVKLNANHCAILVFLVPDFKEALIVLKRALAHLAVSKVHHVASTDRVLVLLILEKGVAYLGVTRLPSQFTLYRDRALNFHPLDLKVGWLRHEG